MKIGIRDGSKDGLFFSGLCIEKLEETTRPFWVCEVSDEKWAEWLAYLNQHDAWEAFWEGQCVKTNRTR